VVCDCSCHFAQLLGPSPCALSCSTAMFDAGHFLCALQELCTLLNRPSPVMSIGEEATWITLGIAPACMLAPTARSVAVAARGSIDIQLLSGHCTMENVGLTLPVAFWHCTSPETLLHMLLEGRFASAGNLGSKAHKPDGLYAFSNRDVSSESKYARQGCQLKFKATCFAISAVNSRKLNVVPEGVACRLHRQDHKQWGAPGAEWVFNPRSCHIIACRVRTTVFDRLMQAVTAALGDLGSGLLQPPLASSSSNLQPLEATCFTRPGQPFHEARCMSINNYILPAADCECVCVCACMFAYVWALLHSRSTGHVTCRCCCTAMYVCKFCNQ